MNETCRLRHFVERQIGSADDVEDYARRALDRRLQKRRIDRKADCVDDAVLALCNADAHVRVAAVFQDGPDVCEVEIDERGRHDKVGNAADTLFQDLVRHAERVRHRRVLRHDLADLLIGNDHDGIDVFSQILNALDGVVHSALAFKLERFRDNGNGENFLIFCDFCNHGSGARTRTASHARGDEQKVRPLDGARKLFLALFGGFPTDFGFCARAETLGPLTADLNLRLCLVARKNLRVGIDGDIFGARDPRLDHAVYGVVARAADADDADFRSSAQRKIVCGSSRRAVARVIPSDKGYVVVEHKF